MEKIETIHDRISLLVQAFGEGKNTVFAALIGENEANIRGYRSNIVPKYPLLEKIVKSLDVSSDWLLTGRGEMCRTKEAISETNAPTLTLMEERLLALIKEKDAQIEKQARLIGRLEAESEISNKKSDNSMDAGDATCADAVG